MAKKTGKIDNATIIKTLHSGIVADRRGQPQLGQVRRAVGLDDADRVDRRQAPAGVPAGPGAARPGDPQAALGRLTGRGPAEGGTVAPHRAGDDPGSSDRRGVRADGERPDAGLRRHAGDQRRPGGDDRRRRVRQLHAVHRLPHRPVRVDRAHDPGGVRRRGRPAARVHPAAAHRRARGAVAAGDVGDRAGDRGRPLGDLHDHLPRDPAGLRERHPERRAGTGSRSCGWPRSPSRA